MKNKIKREQRPVTGLLWTVGRRVQLGSAIENAIQLKEER